MNILFLLLTIISLLGEPIFLILALFNLIRKKPAKKLIAGDVVYIPAGIKHWHGAAKNSWFSHIAVECPGMNTSTEWLEPVTDDQYNNLV